MMRWIAAAALLLLTACSLLPSNFDSQEHAVLVTVAQLSADNAICNNRELAQVHSRALYQQADWLHRYGSSLPQNTDLANQESQLLAIASELKQRYERGEVSVVYCRSKMDNISRAAQIMIKSSAGRPRL